MRVEPFESLTVDLTQFFMFCDIFLFAAKNVTNREHILKSIFDLHHHLKVKKNTQGITIVEINRKKGHSKNEFWVLIKL